MCCVCVERVPVHMHVDPEVDQMSSSIFCIFPPENISYRTWNLPAHLGWQRSRCDITHTYWHTQMFGFRLHCFVSK